MDERTVPEIDIDAGPGADMPPEAGEEEADAD